MLRNIGKQSGESVESVESGRRKGRLRWEGFAERKVLSLVWKSEGVLDIMDILHTVVSRWNCRGAT